MKDLPSFTLTEEQYAKIVVSSVKIQDGNSYI